MGGYAGQPWQQAGCVVKAGVVEPPIKDGSSVLGGVEFQLLRCVAQLGYVVLTALGELPQSAYAGSHDGCCDDEILP